MKQIGQLLPETETDGLLEDGGFDAFWGSYPRRTDKKAALRAWEKLNERDRLAACSGAVYHAENNPQWRDKTLIPHPSTFLNGRRWEDEIVVPRREEVTEDVSDIPRMVWSAMTQLFGQSWINKHGDRPGPVWRTQLNYLTAADVARGLRKLTDRGDEHPPALPYFVSLCKRSADDLEEFKSLPRPEPTPGVAEQAIAEMKAALGIR